MLEEIGGWGISEGDSSGVFPCFSPSIFILFHSINIIGWWWCSGSNTLITLTLASNVDSYVYTCNTCIHPRGILLSRGL